MHTQAILMTSTALETHRSKPHTHGGTWILIKPAFIAPQTPFNLPNWLSNGEIMALDPQFLYGNVLMR